jgi:hypothetical protein
MRHFGATHLILLLFLNFSEIREYLGPKRNFALGGVKSIYGLLSVMMLGSILQS